MLKVWKKSWEPFGSCQLNIEANPAHFHLSLAGLAVLFSRQLLNGSHNFFQTFSIFLKDYLIQNPQTTIALPFLTHNISAIGGVACLYRGVCQTSHVEKGPRLIKLGWSYFYSSIFMDYHKLFVPYSIFIHNMIVKLKTFGFPFQHAI
jgi:hypothetical protein